MKNQMVGICKFAIIYKNLWIEVLWAKYTQDTKSVIPTAIFPDHNGQELTGQRNIGEISRNARFISSFIIEIKYNKRRLSKANHKSGVVCESSQVTLGRSNPSWASKALFSQPCFSLITLTFGLMSPITDAEASWWQDLCSIRIYIPKFNKQ